MTVKDDTANQKEYDKLRMVEFLEFIGRIAHTKYIDEEETPLADKITRILDDIFAPYHLKRITQEDTIESCSSSDESVVFAGDATPEFTSGIVSPMNVWPEDDQIILTQRDE